jgi:hypothetical protein
MNDLSQRLAHEADQFARRGGTELDLGQVLDRAGEIKRGRRLRATVVMAAVVLAVAVPTALVASGGHRDKPVTPSHHTSSERAPLGLDGLKAGAPPRTGWFEGKVWTGPDGKQVQVSGGSDPVAVERVGDSLLMDTVEGTRTRASLVPPAGETASVVQSWPMEGSFAVSASGNVVAFVQPDGTVMAVQDGGSRNFELGRIPEGSGFTAVAVDGENCSGRSEEVGCRVYVSSSGKDPATWVTAPHDAVAQRVTTDLLRTVDRADDGRIAGMLSATDTGSCSAVVDGLKTLWTTCDYAFRSFSPDGDLLLAGPAYGDGAGDSTLTVLDASTGEVVLQLQCVEGDFVAGATWEDSTHVLAEVHQDGTWAIVRIAINGSRELAAGPVDGTEPYVSPFVLPSS